MKHRQVKQQLASVSAEAVLSRASVVVFEFCKPPDGPLRCDYVSRGSARLFGVRPCEARRRINSLLRRVLPDDRKTFHESLGASCGMMSPWQWEGRVESPMGLTEWVFAEANPRLGKRGAVLWDGAFSRITRQKQAEFAYRNSYHWLEDAVQQRTRALRESQAEMLLRLGKAAEYRDQETGSHIIRMSHYCSVLARGAGVSESECELILLAATMHDIGKIGVPDAVLLKPGSLAEDERERMNAHVIIGSQLLGGGSSDLLRTAEIIARTHHERWDGSGYPNGPSGKQIHLYGRVAAIADVFDALTSKRPYKRAWTVEEAVAEIVASSGSQFDPVLVEVFQTVLPEIIEVKNRYGSDSDDSDLLAA